MDFKQYLEMADVPGHPPSNLPAHPPADLKKPPTLDALLSNATWLCDQLLVIADDIVNGRFGADPHVGERISGNADLHHAAEEALNWVRQYQEIVRDANNDHAPGHEMGSGPQTA